MKGVKEQVIPCHPAGYLAPDALIDDDENLDIDYGDWDDDPDSDD
jgi:hypothetical protein